MRHQSAQSGPARRAPLRPALALAALAALGLAACEAPTRARVPISEAAAAAPEPELGETARFTRIAEAAGTTAEDMGADRDALAARAADLRATAAGLAGPVIDPATRARLTEARTSGISLPAD